MAELFTADEIAYVARCGEVFAGEYEHEALSAIEKPHILDIGANIGAFAIWASRRWPGCSLTCYEPNARIGPKRRSNLEHFGVQAIDHQVAVGERHEEIELCDVGRDIDGLTTTLQGHDAKVVERVQCIDAGTLPLADIVKIDCEGAECFVLDRYQWWDEVKAVLVEWHTVPNRVLAERVLDANGLKCLRGRGERGIHPGFGIAYGSQVWMRDVLTG